MNAILLSAGFGTRFQPYTKSAAKPTIPFLNLPLIGYSLYYANKWSSNNIIINTHHLPETVDTCLSELKLNSRLISEIKIINETPNILDSGGGIKNAEKYLNSNEHFLVFNTDIPHILPNIDFNKIKEQHCQTNSLVTFITCDLDDLGSKIRGVWSEENSNEVIDIGLGPKDGLICKHYTGIMLISKELLNLQPHGKPHNIIYDIILPAIKNGHKVSTFHINSLKWFETGNLESYLNASFKVLNELIKKPKSDYSTEFNRALKEFNIYNHIRSGENYNLISKNEALNPIPHNKLQGSIVLGSDIDLTGVNSLKNSVIYSTPAPKITDLSSQLIL